MPKIVLLPGDGIGPEVTAVAEKLLAVVASKFGHTFEFDRQLLGGIAIDETGNPFPDTTHEACKSADAVLLGAVGGPQWDDPNATVRPEQGLLAIRKALGLFANLRPIKLSASLAGASPLKAEIVTGTDILFFRELTGGIYFGPDGKREVDGEEAAFSEMLYKRSEIERIVRLAAEAARGRRNRVTMVDKANVLEV
ncbi:MAG: isocitrate/isopropylmalate family dehydrogenase, partial [Planctomycetota bacterium]